MSSPPGCCLHCMSPQQLCVSWHEVREVASVVCGGERHLRRSRPADAELLQRHG